MDITNPPEEGVSPEEESNWRYSALCGSFSKESPFFQDIWYSEENSWKAAIATSICFQCPVRRECLKNSCDNKESYGIWGGLPFSMRNKKGRVHNFLKLVDLLDPYETEDRNSPYHIQNLDKGDTDERE